MTLSMPILTTIKKSVLIPILKFFTAKCEITYALDEGDFKPVMLEEGVLFDSMVSL